MSDRLIKAGFLTSPRINACSVGARDLWVRLALSCDDFGLFDAAPAMVASQCYPIGMAPARDDVALWLEELEERELIVRYRDETERAFLVLCRWHVIRVRQVRPLYPLPPPEVIKRAIGLRKLLGLAESGVVVKPRNGRQGVGSGGRPGKRSVDAGERLVGDPGVLPSGKRSDSFHEKRYDSFDQKRYDRLGSGTTASGGSGQPASARSGQEEAVTAHARAAKVLGIGEVLNPTATSTASRVRVNGEEAAAAAAKKRVTFNPETRQFDGLQEATLLRWQDMYPDVPIGAELERAAAWIEVNEPESLRADYERFLLGWVSDANTKRARSPSRGHT